MTKFAFLSAAVVFSSALAGPAIAQHSIAHPSYLRYIAATGACPGREAGNPYDKQTDYWGWSAWRARGGWDDHNDLNCLRGNRLRYQF
jgi:hypothetical protein